MFNSAWRLDRRTMLRGLGCGIGLPWLEAMGSAAASGAAGPPTRPRRFCGVFFANGVGLPGKDKPELRDWHWFPHTPGADYTFNKPLEPLAPHRPDITILGGLSHPTSREMVGHATGDLWLTGADVRQNVNNSISLDQMIARKVGGQTRVPSLVMSSHGGVGPQTRATTISFNGEGRPIPAASKPRQIFERLFAQVGDDDKAARRRALIRGRRTNGRWATCF